MTDEAPELVVSTGAATRDMDLLARVLLDSTPGVMMLLDREGRIRAANAPMARRFRREPADLIGAYCYDLVAPELAQARRARIDEVFATGRPGRFEDAREGRAFDNNILPVFDSEGRVSHVAIISLDITDARRTEASLRESEELYRTLAEASRDFIFVIDRDDILLYVNSCAAAAFGCRPEDMIGRGRGEFLADISELPRAHIEAVFDSGRPASVEERLEHSGCEIWLHTSLAPVRDAAGSVHAVLAVSRDITERKHIEEALRQSEERLAQAAAAAQIGMFDWDVARNASTVTPGMAAMFGFAPERTSFTMEDWASRIIAEDRPATDARIAEVIAGREAGYEVQHRVCWPDGTVHWIETRGRYSYDPDGRPVRISGIALDITARKLLEQEREELLRREQAAHAEAQQANAAKDQFLAILSHELRNPLTPVLAGTHILRQLPADHPRVRRTVEVIERNVRLQARLIDDLLDLSRVRRGKITLQRRPVALAEVVEAALDSAAVDLERGGLRLVKDLERGGWVYGDPDRLQQVVFNLLSNAIKFTPAGGDVRIVLRTDEHAAITVEDTGIGIDASLMPHLFEMFRQGEPGGQRKGLGIGLALVKELTEMHGGSVEADSDGRGKGARFTVRLPSIAQPAPREPGRGMESDRRQYAVLIVEDDTDVCSMLSDAFTLEGFAVTAASSAEDALRLLENWRPDVILADIGLPGMSGHDFLLRAREAGLDMPAFAITGFGRSEDMLRSQAVGFAGHFVKPVDIKEVERRVRERLARADRR